MKIQGGPTWLADSRGDKERRCGRQQLAFTLELKEGLSSGARREDPLLQRGDGLRRKKNSTSDVRGDQTQGPCERARARDERVDATVARGGRSRV